MSDLFDYLAWRGDIPLSQVPFGPVDGLILSTLSYVRFQELVPDSPGLSIPLCQAAEAFLSLPEQEAEDRVRCRQDLRLLKALLSASRFASLPLTFYQDRLDPAREMQFSALTVLLDTGEALLVFRGTDSTLVGWKEDFNMSVRCPVPSQSQAVEYYRSVDERASNPFAAHPVRIAVGGHSKGGNLAVYTAMKTQSDHISRIFSHDGPGFMREVTRSHAFHAIEPRVEKTVPESSVIGMLMSTVSRYTIVETNVSGIMQHMGLNWRIENGEFVTKPELTPASRLLDRTLDAWMEQFTDQERACAVDQCYDIIASAGYPSFAELADHMGEALPTIAQAARKTDEATKTLILNILKAFPITAAKSLFEEWPAADGKENETV